MLSTVLHAAIRKPSRYKAASIWELVLRSRLSNHSPVKTGEETRIAMRERGDMRPPSQHTASFAVEARWKLPWFWKSRFRFELEFHKVSAI